MKLERHETPKFLLDIESKISENCRDWLIIVNHEGNTFWLKSKDYAAYGLGLLVLETMKKEFTGEIRDDETEN